MREIKFRAWDKVNNKMLIPAGTGLQINLPTDDFSDADVYWMQYAEKKDDNGKEIYEGDVCRLTLTDRYEQRATHMGGVKPVYFDAIYHCWYFAGFQPIGWGGFKSVEVIGNIYQNPELLNS